MSDLGRAAFSTKEKAGSKLLSSGDAVGTWFPVGKLFRLTRGEDYWVVATFRDGHQGIGELVSLPLRVRMPTACAAGVTRPPYGSPWFYDGLQKARSTNPGLELAWNMQGCKWSVQVSLAKASPISDPEAQFDRRRSPFWSSTASAIRFRAARTVAESPVRRDMFSATPMPALASPPKLAWQIPLYEIYPLFYPERYTVVAAVNIPGKQPVFAVSAPLTSTPLVPWAEPGPDRPTASSPQPPVPKVQDDYATLNRFAGKPFEGLLLNASAKTPSDVKLALVNQSKTPICVKKWEGAAGYNLLVRGPDGKAVPMTEKGKTLFMAARRLILGT